MKRLILCTALIAISLQGSVFAQEKKPEVPTKTQSNFNIRPKLVNDRHWVFLPKDEKIIVELNKWRYYRYISNIDSLLSIFMHDIAFYKDSFDATGSVRIDYAFTANPDVRKIRFKKFTSDGDIYVNKQSDVAKLKIDQDTVRITFQLPSGEKDIVEDDEGVKISGDISLQVTFCLNNYTDIDKMLQNKGMLNHIVDTLAATSKPKHKGSDFSTISFRPFDSAKARYDRFRIRRYLLDNEFDLRHAGGTLVINGGVGVGVIKNTLAPMGEIGIEINDRWSGAPKGVFSFLRLSTAPYFFFGSNALGKTLINDNWFATLEFGTENKKKRNAMGIGYLYSEKGGYFQNTTMKAFVNTRISNRFTICPEIIFSDNFKQIYPGVTLKIF